MIDYYDIQYRGSSCPVYFRDFPDNNFKGAIYIENEYHKKMNNYLRRWRWWLQKVTFNKSEQNLKAPSPIAVTVFGILEDLQPVMRVLVAVSMIALQLSRES